MRKIIKTDRAHATHRLPDLTVYNREGCHLCEQMLSELDVLLNGIVCEIHNIDIDNDKKLQDLYAGRIPVLCTNTEEILAEYFIDALALKRWIDQNKIRI